MSMCSKEKTLQPQSINTLSKWTRSSQCRLMVVSNSETTPQCLTVNSDLKKNNPSGFIRLLVVLQRRGISHLNGFHAFTDQRFVALDCVLYFRGQNKRTAITEQVIKFLGHTRYQIESQRLGKVSIVAKKEVSRQVRSNRAHVLSSQKPCILKHMK